MYDTILTRHIRTVCIEYYCTNCAYIPGQSGTSEEKNKNQSCEIEKFLKAHLLAKLKLGVITTLSYL